MNKTYLMTYDTIKTIGQGALGAMTFGAYHQFTTNKMMEMNNKMMEIKIEHQLQENDLKHREEIKELTMKINERNSKWW